MKKFNILVEAYLKRGTDYSLLYSLDDEGYESYIEKCTIELCLKYSPKKVYGLSKDDVRNSVRNILEELFSGRFRVFTDKKAYSYGTNIDRYRLVFAKTKKEALELSCAFGFTDLDYALVSKKSLRLVDRMERDHVVTDSGEIREFNAFYDIINLYGNVEEVV